MKLLEELAKGRAFHSTFMTTFAIDFGAFEDLILPALKLAGSNNNVLLVDQAMADQSLRDARLPRWAGTHYSFQRVAVDGAFHPKIILQLGRDRGRLFLGSANLTASGIAGNRELVAVIECSSEPSPERMLIVDAWNTLVNWSTDETRSLRHQTQWLLNRSPWLHSADRPNSEPVTLADDTVASWMATDSSQSILKRLIEQIGSGNTVKNLYLMSPYWDTSLATLKLLQKELAPEKTIVLIDNRRALFPKADLATLGQVELMDIAEFAGQRFLHAKFALAQTQDADHLLFGSTNMSFAAMGAMRAAGTNEEANIYRRLPAGAGYEHLGLDKILASAVELGSADIQEPMAIESNNVAGEASVLGQFELQFNVLVRHHNEQTMIDAADIELYDQNSEPCETDLECSSHSDTETQYRIKSSRSEPLYVRISSADGSSPLIPLIRFDRLREVTQESTNKKADQLNRSLSEQIDEDIHLLDLITQFQRLDTQDTLAVSRDKPKGEVGVQTYQTMGYENFIQRSAGSSASVSSLRNSFAGTTQFSVYRYLIQLLGQSVDTIVWNPVDDDPDFDVLDEEKDAEERSQDAGEPEAFRAPIAEDTDAPAKSKWMQRKQGMEDLVKAVSTVGELVKANAVNEALYPVDLLRIHALLRILLSAAYAGKYREASDLADRKCLAATDHEYTWPRLVGRTLFSLFKTTHPPIRSLRLDESFDQLPDDVLQAFGCCIWAGRAAEIATKEEPLKGLEGTVLAMYQEMSLPVHLIATGPLVEYLQLMDTRYANQLGITKGSILDMHTRTCAQIS